MNSSEIINNKNDEVLVEQCLLSMSTNNEPPKYAQCDEPSFVSDEEYQVEVDHKKIEIHSSTSTSRSMHSYSYDNMLKANELPNSNQWEIEKYASVQCEMIQIWDSTKGADNSEIKLLEAIIPHERKALALKLFHENDYQIGGILDKVMGLSHESDWPEEAKTVFSSSITNTDKNFASLARRLNKKAGDCQEYYYSKFKRTQEYSRMKRALRRTVKTRTSDVELSTTLGRDN